MRWGVTHRHAGWSELLQHVGDDDLQQGLSEELLAHRAAVVVVFLTVGTEKERTNVFILGSLEMNKTKLTC